MPRIQRLAIPHRRVRTAIANGKRILDGVDGRSMVARRYRELQAVIANYVDPSGDLTEGQMQIIRSAVGLIILRERLDTRAVNNQKVDSLEYTRIANALNRTLKTLGLERRAKDITYKSIEQHFIEGSAA